MTVEISVFYNPSGKSSRVWAYAAMEDRERVFAFHGKGGKVGAAREITDSGILNFKHKLRIAIERGYEKKNDGFKENVQNLFLRRKNGSEVDEGDILSVLSNIVFDGSSGQIVSINSGYIDTIGMDWGLGDPPALSGSPTEKRILKVKTKRCSNSVWSF